MKRELENDYLWISIDESTDAEGRYIVLVIAGALRISESSKPFLLFCDVVEHVNQTTISQVVIFILWSCK